MPQAPTPPPHPVRPVATRTSSIPELTAPMTSPGSPATTETASAAPNPLPTNPAPPTPFIPPPQPQRQPPPTSRTDRPARSINPDGTGALQEASLRSFMFRADRQCQIYLDRLAPFKLYRWIGLVVLLLIFLLRMFLVEGFYIVAYVLFIFILNQFILFLQPKDRAALVAKATSDTGTDIAEEGGAERAALPTLDDEEFRPFVRRLPEFKFWYSTSYATMLAFCATFFKAFDVPVFWPLLLFYFILLFVATMRRQWQDMKKLKYVPWDIGNKKVYRSDPKRVSVARPQPNATQNVVNASGRAPAPVPTIQIAQKKPAAQSMAPQAPVQS